MEHVGAEPRVVGDEPVKATAWGWIGIESDDGCRGEVERAVTNLVEQLAQVIVEGIARRHVYVAVRTGL